MEQIQQVVAMLGKGDQLSKLAGSSGGLSETIENFYNSVGHVKYGRKDPASRAVTVGSQFALGTMAINAAQFLGAPLALIDQDLHNQWIAFNKQSWGLLITTMTSWWSPTLVRVSGDKSVRGQLSKTSDGALYCDFSERMVLTANHQIYTDWLYLWYIGYTRGMHGRIHVVLKESLKKIPVVGWGMTLSKFIFLKRNWEEDKAGLAKHLHSLNKPEDPMWLMVFPEGTNLAPSTREKSAAWAAKNGYKDYQHVLLPRTTGLHFMLLKLRDTVDYMYDCTIGYEGVKRGEYAQDIYTIESSWLSGRPPASVNMHWRRFKLSSIPLDDINQFDLWLRARWAEKDALMENYMQIGRFPADVGVDQTPEGETRHGAGYIETYVKPQNWYEILQVFAPIASFILVLFYFYNITIPPSMFSTLQDWAGLSEDEIKQKLRIGPAPKLGPKVITSKSVAKTLRPPWVGSDTASVSNASVTTTQTFKTMPKQSYLRSGPQVQPPSIPTPTPSVNGTVAKQPPATASPAKTPTAAKAPPTKPAIATAKPTNPTIPKAKPTQSAIATAKPTKPTATKAAATQKAQAKPKPIPVKKPLPKTLFPTQFPPKAPAPKKPLPKTVLPPSSTPSSTATSKPSTTKTPSKLAPTKAPATKLAPTSASKPTAKKPTTTLPKTNLPPRGASLQAPSSTWSDTTAVETPWADRPSGKRAVKAQETRSDRVKLEKKAQRLHLEKVGE